MTIEEIKKEFPEQVNSGRVFIIGIQTKDGNRYSLRIGQQIISKANIDLNGAKPQIKTGFHHGIPKHKLEEDGYTPGMLLAEGWNLSVKHCYNPQYPSQSCRKNQNGDILTHEGSPYYEHVELIWGPPKIDLWISDQYQAQLETDKKNPYTLVEDLLEDQVQHITENIEDIPFG